MALEIARRWVGGRWRTSVEQEGNSGSQSVRVVGPFSYDYNDFPVANEQVVFTPDAGDFILKGFADQTTFVPFDDDGSIDFSLGPNPDYDNIVAGETFWAFVTFQADYIPDSDGSDNAALSTTGVPGMMCTGAPIKLRSQAVNGNGTEGHMDLYFLIATPVAP